MNLKTLRNLSTKNSSDKINPDYVKEAIKIRVVEETFLELFTQGQLNGTVHTCVGQEFSAVAVCSNLKKNDWVTSNHRCHGHFISKTGNWKGLIDELRGFSTGVSKGIGSSQHLFDKGFLSNGIQGSLLPVGSGIALYNKLNKNNSICVSFIGEGTLGEGILYESLNISSLYEVPQLIVCENNYYSQSTEQNSAVSGKILDRPKAFGMETFEANTWDLEELFQITKEAIDYVRKGKPAFLNIHTYRLNAHSKGDDDRGLEEIEFFSKNDTLNRLLEENRWQKEKKLFQEKVQEHLNSSLKETLDEADYFIDQLPRKGLSKLTDVKNTDTRMVKSLNKTYRKFLENGSFFIGEDIVDPYGGAFKVTNGFSTDFPNQVYQSPISEAGLVGVSIGMSLMGVRSFAEIMFGDFTTLAFDQLMNNASKMHHMYAFQVDVPLIIRTPMGGKRGYGPTHSQSLEKFLVGIDNTLVIALSSLIDPELVLNDLDKIKCPTVIIENKLDYGKLLWKHNNQYSFKREEKPFGGSILSPLFSDPTITIVSYGETARHIADNLELFFEETDEILELVCLTQIHPADISLIESSVKKTKRLITVEDGSKAFGIGAEIISSLLEKKLNLEYLLRIGAKPYPIPSISALESKSLPTIDNIINSYLKNPYEE